MNRSTHADSNLTTEIGTAPSTRNDTFNETFFRIVCQLFPPEFTLGAGVLLGTYDPE